MRVIPDFAPALRAALAPLGAPRQCALLNYPNHYNVGDHAIWLGTVDFLRSLNTRIAYTCDLDDYSPLSLAAALDPDDPLLLLGGGSFGDLWPDRQAFHETIVAAHPHRAIFLLPQSIHFQNAALERRAAEVFNAHGGVTLFARDRTSYERMGEQFSGCSVHLAPDMALQLSGWLSSVAPAGDPDPRTLLLARNDRECFASQATALPGALRQDWTPYQRKWRWGRACVPFSLAVARWHRRLWACGISHPSEFAARSAWFRGLTAHPAGALADAPGCRLSLDLLWYGCRQLSGHPAVVTDRLHAHVLAAMLGVPNVLLPNVYPKNRAFFETWMSALPWCRFGTQAVDIPAALAAAVAG